MKRCPRCKVGRIDRDRCSQCGFKIASSEEHARENGTACTEQPYRSRFGAGGNLAVPLAVTGCQYLSAHINEIVQKTACLY